MLPIVCDWEDYKPIDKLNKKWKCHKNGFVSCQHHQDDQNKDVFIHELVMVMKNQDNNLQNQNKPIVHINRLGLDNRRKNLDYKGAKQSSHNTKKKKRTLTLPKDSGIVGNDIPTYIWYLKPNGTHGDRFMVDIGDVKWKTTASKTISLVEKLEHAKEYLKQLRVNHPDLFDDRSMNGDYSKQARTLAKEYQEIIKKAGFNNVRVNLNHNKTSELLG